MVLLQVITITAPRVVFGRSTASCDVQLDGTPDRPNMVSRAHALFQLVPRSVGAGCDLTVEDLHSMNGVMVNGVRVACAVLVDGDVITFGSAKHLTVGQAHEAFPGACSPGTSPSTQRTSALTPSGSASRRRTAPEGLGTTVLPLSYVVAYGDAPSGGVKGCGGVVCPSPPVIARGNSLFVHSPSGGGGNGHGSGNINSSAAVPVVGFSTPPGTISVGRSMPTSANGGQSPPSTTPPQPAQPAGIAHDGRGRRKVTLPVAGQQGDVGAAPITGVVSLHRGPPVAVSALPWMVDLNPPYGPGGHRQWQLNVEVEARAGGDPVPLGFVKISKQCTFVDVRAMLNDEVRRGLLFLHL